MKLWFKAKKYGWGWTPATSEGWLVMLVYILAVTRIFWKIDKNYHSGSDSLIGFALPFVILTLALFAICYWKGEKPGWHWGDR